MSLWRCCSRWRRVLHCLRGGAEGDFVARHRRPPPCRCILPSCANGFVRTIAGVSQNHTSNGCKVSFPQSLDLSSSSFVSRAQARLRSLSNLRHCRLRPRDNWIVFNTSLCRSLQFRVYENMTEMEPLGKASSRIPQLARCLFSVISVTEQKKNHSGAEGDAEVAPRFQSIVIAGLKMLYKARYCARNLTVILQTSTRKTPYSPPRKNPRAAQILCLRST